MKSNKFGLKIKKRKTGVLNIVGQRALAKQLVCELTGRELRRSKSGRPVVSRDLDVSISHKENIVCAAVVKAPYRIGIDIESLGQNLNEKCFFGPVISEEEAFFLKKFCRTKKLSISSGIAVFWSIKESFFKCLDCDLKPSRISIGRINKGGRVNLLFPYKEIERLMKRKRMVHCLTRVGLAGDYVYSETIMKKMR